MAATKQTNNEENIGTTSAFCYGYSHLGKHEPIQCDLSNHFLNQKTNPVTGTKKICFVELDAQCNQQASNMLRD